MTDPTYLTIGFTRKTHGVHGELKASIEPDYLEIIATKGRIFLDLRGRKVPHFIQSIRGAGEPIIKFEDVNNREDALPLQSRELFLLESDLPEDFEVEETDELRYGHLVEFTLVDQTAGLVGVIEEVLDMPQQEMAVVRYRDREVLVPLNERFVVSIDEAAREVVVDLPEGLLDM